LKAGSENLIDGFMVHVRRTRRADMDDLTNDYCIIIEVFPVSGQIVVSEHISPYRNCHR